MDGLANSAETMPCTNCGHEIRRGMLRCRECGQAMVETVEEDAADEFELSGAQLLPSLDPKCPLCGAFLEPGTTDCGACTSALLDQLLNGQLLNGGPESQGTAGDSNSGTSRASNSGSKLHVRRAVHVGHQDRALPGIGPSTKLREIPTRPRQADPATTQAKSAGTVKARGKSVSQFAAPQEIQAANQKAVNQHAANQQAAAREEHTAQEADSEAGASTTVETSAACTALLASLATADAQLRCGIATALGKLGDKEAMVPLERHLSDQDIRVRRAVAGALVQLGHPKGQTLLDIAERKPAAALIADHRASSPYSSPKPRTSSGGGGIDAGTLKVLGGAVVAIGVVAGGIWYWMNSPPPSPAGKKAKSSAAKKAAAKKAGKAP